MQPAVAIILYFYLCEMYRQPKGGFGVFINWLCIKKCIPINIPILYKPLEFPTVFFTLYLLHVTLKILMLSKVGLKIDGCTLKFLEIS